MDADLKKILSLDEKNRKLIQYKENLEKEKKDVSKTKDSSLFEKSKKISEQILKYAKDQTNIKKPDILDSAKGVFNKETNSQNSLDYNLAMTIPPKEALAGTNKKISYEIDGAPEQLMIRIPEKFPNGGKLRIKGKGHSKNEKRGDLILQVRISS